MVSLLDADVLNFEEDGFRNVDIHKSDDYITFRTNVKSREEFERWREVFLFKSSMCFNSYKLYPCVRKVFHQQLICHHGTQHKGVKKTSTGCRVFMDVSIRIVHKKAVRNDPLLNDFPCFVKIQGNHNHPLDSADALNQLRVQPSTRGVFYKYFEQGMTTAQAHRHHVMKMNLCDDLQGQENQAMNPSPRAIAYMRNEWLKKEYGGLNKPSMYEALKKYGEDHQEITLKIEHDGDQFCVALITPFMERAHKQLKEAGEVVFVDATSCVDQLNTAVIPLLCAGPAGAVPLAVLFTSSQDEATLTKGFGMIKEGLGDCAFYGRGEPQSFMTNNCDASRNALAKTWPTSQRFLCIFHLLQQIWRWLLDSKHGIQKHNQQELMAATKSLVYAKSRDEFQKIWENIQAGSLFKGYPNFISYLTSLIKRKEEWAIAFRASMILRGHHTNNFCEATMCIIKDIVLNRCKAYNTVQLVVFMVEIFDYYMRQRLVDVALSRRRVKTMSMDKLSVDAVQSFGDGKFKVQSQSEPAKEYEVDLNTGMCTCIKGENGAICKHQVACADFSMTVVPQVFIMTSESRQWLVALALGPDNAPNERFFKSLSSLESPESKGSNTYSLNSNVKVEMDETNTHGIVKMEVDVVPDEVMPEVLIANKENVVESQSVVEPNCLSDNSQPVTADNSQVVAKSRIAAEMLIEAAARFGNPHSMAALDKFMQRIKALKTANQFNSLLHISGSSVKNGGAGRGKIPCQPTSIARRLTGRPRGAAPLGKGHRPTGTTTPQAKRPRNLAYNIQHNVANAKSHGNGH